MNQGEFGPLSYRTYHRGYELSMNTGLCGGRAEATLTHDDIIGHGQHALAHVLSTHLTRLDALAGHGAGIS